MTVTHGRHLHGHFNAHLQKAILVFADEAVWGGDREAESKLKEMITEPRGIIEMKHKDAQTQIRSCMRIILATNSDWAAKVSLSDRRYFVLEPSILKSASTINSGGNINLLLLSLISNVS